jgi:hypothetical protein
MLSLDAYYSGTSSKQNRVEDPCFSANIFVFAKNLVNNLFLVVVVVVVLLLCVLTYWQTVENVNEGLPQFNAVLAFALVVEAVNSEGKINIDNYFLRLKKKSKSHFNN